LAFHTLDLVHSLFGALPDSSRDPRPGSSNLIAEAWKVAGRKVYKRAKLEEIYDLAGESIGIPVALDSPAIETFRLQLSRYAELNRHRDQLDQRAQGCSPAIRTFNG